MVDWLLDAHRVAPLQFEMGGGWAPISVRDQMVRGQELVRRAIEAQLIGSARPLIVVGAGAGGLAAAVTAADQRIPIPVIVIERASRAFDRQVGVTARKLHPYVYDWPLDRFAEVRFAPPPAPAVLAWKEADADDCAVQWQAALAAHRSRPIVWYGATIAPSSSSALSIVQVGRFLRVLVQRTPVRRIWLRAGMLLSSVGFGAELTTVGSSNQAYVYEGERFWQNDRLADPNLAASKIVIAGGGDGGLQDAMRALLVPTFHDVRALLAKLPPIPDDLRVMIADADDTAQRAWLWSPDRANDCPILSTLHQRVKIAVDAYWAANSTPITDALEHCWRANVNVTLAHPCTHFGRGYVLNRFLVLLLARAAPDGRLTIEPNRLLDAADHLGGGACAIAPCPSRHRATFLHATCRSTPTVPSSSRDADLLIIRGGVGPPTSPLATSPVANRRQHLPDRPR